MRTAERRNGAQSPLMTDETRGQAIKRRRLALGINSMRRFAQATGRDRETLGDAEADADTTLDSTFDWIEAWLARAEAESGLTDAGPAPSMVEVELHDVYGVGEIIARGDPDQVADAVAKILERLREQGDA